MEGRGARKPVSGTLIQINGKIFRLDAGRLTVIWHTINLVSLSPSEPLITPFLFFSLARLVFSHSLLSRTCRAASHSLIDYEANGDDDVLLDN